MTRVFVYGTLKRGGKIRGLDSLNWTRNQESATFIGAATTKESAFSLYDLGPFPAASLRGEHKIAGEVWEVNDEMFATLDSIEGYPDFYSRTVIDTTQGKAWMYYLPNAEQEYSDWNITPEQGDTVSWNEK